MAFFRRFFPVVTAGFAFAVTAHSQTEPLVAGRAVVGIAFTLTQTIGAYPLSPAKREAEQGKEIEYDGALNPLGFNSETAGSDYFSQRTNTVKKKLADGAVYPVEQITQVSRKALVQSYLTADFIKDLIARGGVLNEVPSDALAWKGYGLVAVTFKDFDQDRRFFFAEKKGKVPVFVGWEKREGEAAALSAGMCLLTETMWGEAVTGIRKISRKTVYDTILLPSGALVNEALEQPLPLIVSETLTGKAAFAVWIFPAGTGPFRDLRLAGKVTYSAPYDTKRRVYVKGAATAAGLAGNQFVTYGEGTTALVQPEAVVEGAFTIGAEVLLKTEADARVYWTAVPASLRP